MHASDVTIDNIYDWITEDHSFAVRVIGEPLPSGHVLVADMVGDVFIARIANIAPIEE